MSLYGNVKRIGSASFQFDRKYSNRKQMDDNAATDGVYAGRYVLVEYGQRFGRSESEVVTVTPGTATSSSADITYAYQNVGTEDLYNPATTYYTLNEQNKYVEYTYNSANWATDVANNKVFYQVPKINFRIINTSTGVQIENIIENPTFKANAAIDLNKYGAVYDSTVWQKIYVNENGNSKDKYIMIAELNAIVPKLDVTQNKPIAYKALVNEINNYLTEGIITGKVEDGQLKETVRLVNAEEKYNKPYFDTALDTELTYLIHWPTPVNLEIDNRNVDFNEKGFNMVYGYEEDDGVSAIAWIPKGLESYRKIYEEGHENDANYLKHDFGNNPLAKLTQGADVDTKMLFMSFPALGNAMNALYNLLYGKPEPEEGESLKHGVMRPYFKQFLDDVHLTNFVSVPNGDGTDYIYVTYLDDDGQLQYAKVEGVFGEEVIATLNENDAIKIYENGSLEPSDYVEICFIRESDGGVFPLSSEEYRNLQKIHNSESGVDVPIESGQFVLWDKRVSDHPIIVKIHTPSGDEDNLDWLSQIPGLADILANNTAGLATVLSSLFGDVDPLTGTTRYYLYTDWLASTEDGSSGPAVENKPKVVGGYPQEFINVPSGVENTNAYGDTIYETAGYFWDLNESTTTNLKVPYPHLETKTSDKFTGGQYSVDYNTWQLVSYVAPNLKVIVTKLPTAIVLDANNQAAAQENQDYVTVQQTNNLVTITSSHELNTFLEDTKARQWVNLDLDTGLSSIRNVRFYNPASENEEILVLDAGYESQMDSLGLERGHILVTVAADEIADVPRVIGLGASGFEDTIITIRYLGSD